MVAVFTPAFDDREPEEQSRDLFRRTIVPLRLELLRMALRMTSHKEDAEDLLHDSFLKALSNVDSLADEKNARAWMRSILRNTFVSGLRARMRAPVELVPGNDMERVMGCLREQARAVDERAEILDAVGRLDEPFREPVVLCDLVGMTYEDAALKIGCPLGTLMSRLSRARGKLREILKA